MFKEVSSRYISPKLQCLLWGRAAGRCEFAGCNIELWKSPTTGEAVNIAEKAHIWAFSEDGPRGNKGIEAELINDISNLMLVCNPCHETIDQSDDGGNYSVDLLQAMKLAHETRVEMVTGIDPSKTSHVLHYTAQIGDQFPQVSWNESVTAMFPNRYPAEQRPIDLGIKGGSFKDRDDQYWEVEVHNLQSKCQRLVIDRIAAGEIEHLSVFAIAPQPLLILLGTILTDIPNTDVFQRQREPAGWQWSGSAPLATFQVIRPADQSGVPVLVVAISADVSPERIETAIGEKVSAWVIKVDSPHNDIIKNKDQLREFRSLMRLLLNEIKSVHGQSSTLHVFPVSPVSIAIELGRSRMPKADMPWRIYDQIPAKGGFAHAISIHEGGLK